MHSASYQLAGRNHSNQFVHADLASTTLGRLFTDQLAMKYIDRHTMYLAGRRTKAKYGEVRSWDTDADAETHLRSGVQFEPGVGLFILEIQEHIYDILVKCCCENLAEDTVLATLMKSCVEE